MLAAFLVVTSGRVDGIARILGYCVAAACAPLIAKLLRAASRRADPPSTRIGVFVGRDWLLVRVTGWCALLPWSRVRDARLENVRSDNGWFRHVVVYYLTPEGQPGELVLSTSPPDLAEMRREIAVRARA